MNDTNTTDNFHFFAASCITWAATNDTRDLRALLKLMDSEPYEYNLWLVPLPTPSTYEIEFWQPKVDGVMHLGTFVPAKRKTLDAKRKKLNARR